MVAREQRHLAKESEDAANLKEANFLQACEQRRHAEHRRVLNRTRNMAYEAAARARRLRRRHQAQVNDEQRSEREATRWKTKLQADLQSVERLVYNMRNLRIPKADSLPSMIWLMLLRWLARLSVFLSRKLLTVSFPP